jgi:RNA polymerase sigma-70 factor (ECF subfamily)
MIPSTHLSILNALKEAGPSEEAWERFQRRYEGTILRWCLRHGLQQADAEDITQRVLLKLYRTLPGHEHDPSRPFRSWLSTVVANAVRDFFRQAERHPDARGAGGTSFQEQLARLQEPESTDELATELEGQDAALKAAIEGVKGRVSESVWQAFHRTVIDGQPVADVAKELGMSTGAAYQAKYRVSQMIAEVYGREAP